MILSVFVFGIAATEGKIRSLEFRNKFILKELPEL